MINLIINLLTNNKTNNIKIIQQKKNILADYIIIATCTSTKHLFSSLNKIKQKIKIHYKLSNIIISGKKTDWVVIYIEDIVIHLMLENCRKLYDLESLYEN